MGKERGPWCAHTPGLEQGLKLEVHWDQLLLHDNGLSEHSNGSQMYFHKNTV